MASIEDIKSTIQGELKQICDRLDAIETRLPESQSPPLIPASSQNNIDTTSSTDNQASSATECGNIQRDFENIKDSTNRVILPSHLKVNDAAAGIKQDCKATLKILSKTARYADTGLNIFASSPTAILNETDIQHLYTVLHAQIIFLQTEYSGLVVKSTFDEETSRLFRQLETNASSFSDRSLSNIRVAAELSAIRGRTTHQRQNHQRGRGGFNTGHRSRGRGNFRVFNNRSTDFPTQPDPDRST